MVEAFMKVAKDCDLGLQNNAGQTALDFAKERTALEEALKVNMERAIREGTYKESKYIF